ncbi:two-component hybrid sensor and regulator [Treponema primitia ZAS-2]|uniref:Two-component hybrid sensor and regulator n=1 Tax=Treponema primitia (strain ATCC BAA-887 / DSM 12427 / ZAS-2) TaxID=545694 RepID=F5YKI6_TREPZ|nr:response regulator [Treponema primitia]AEF84752.1 two-component hybrid sensor and regulator [Treponema primitia ZAS-2]
MNTKKRILIADDDPLNVEFFEVILSKLGFAVEKAEDGQAALEQVKKFHPDLIILDNIMPKMSGWELTRLLKGDPKYQEIPIIMLSALDDVKDKVEGFELGIDDYITKPFNFSEVLARIRAVLRNRELFGQILVRESRLSQAEELSADIKASMGDFIKGMDDLDAAITQVSRSTETIDEKTLPRLLDLIKDKTVSMRKHIAELDARVERTLSEWEDLKKNEIGIKTLETRIQHSLRQDMEDHGKDR